MSQEYAVTFCATADVETTVYVTGETEEECRSRALEKIRDGDAVWEYNGVHDDIDLASILPL